MTLAIKGDRMAAVGAANSTWIEHARAASQILPPGVPQLDLAKVHDLDAEGERLWASYVARLRAEPGIAITETGRRDGK